MSISEETLPNLADVQGRRFATVCCWFLGLGSLLAWNSMLTIADYYYQVFPDYHPSRVLTLMYQPCAVASMIYLAWNEAKINTRKRNLGGYCLFTASSALLVVLDLATSGRGYIVSYVLLCLLCGSLGVADALVGGGMVGDLSFMDPIFLQSFLGGLAASGALTSGLRLITKAVFDNTNQGLRKGALLFLAITALMELLCLLLYKCIFAKVPIIRYYRAKASSEGSSTVSADLVAAGGGGVIQDENKVAGRLTTKQLLIQNWDYALDLYLIYVLTLSIFPGFLYENTGAHSLGSWYPLVLIALYNVWDLVARYMPLLGWLRIESRWGLTAACFARVVFVPAFYFTAKYADQGWMMMLITLLGLTNGHLTVCVMMNYPNPDKYKGPEQNALGNVLMVFLLGGICSGAALDWLWLIGHGTF